MWNNSSLFATVGVGLAFFAFFYHHFWGKKTVGLRVADSLVDLVGNTPLLKLSKISQLTNCSIYVKCEHLNPGGSPKDRVALRIIQEALASGEFTLHPSSTIVEGTVGSTGIALAMMAKLLGIKCYIVCPNDQALEKYRWLEQWDAQLEKVAPASIVLPDHFVNLAKQRAGELELKLGRGKVLFADQFENLANFRAHYYGTGPEIWQQMDGCLDGFIAGAGTGGTLAGVTRCLKERRKSVQAVLADPVGSGLYNRVKHGVLYTREEAEGTRKRHQVDTVVEGIGLNRMTANLDMVLSSSPSSSSSAWIDDAVKVTDQEAIWMSRFLLHQEGLWVGSSTAVNVVATVKTAIRLGPGKRLVTISCDSGFRHLTKFWNDEHLLSLGFNTTCPTDLSFLGV